MMKAKHRDELVIGITVLSAQGLKAPSSPFSRRLRPFARLGIVPPAAENASCSSGGRGDLIMHTTRVDDEGGTCPVWGDSFRLPMNTSSFVSNTACFSIILQVNTKRFMRGSSQLGWCLIPAADIMEGLLLPAGSIRHLSYRLRDVDGTRGHGIIHLSLRLEGTLLVALGEEIPHSDQIDMPVIGISASIYRMNNS